MRQVLPNGWEVFPERLRLSPSAQTGVRPRATRFLNIEFQRPPRHLLGKTLECSIQDIAFGESATHGVGRIEDESVILPEREES